MLEQQTEADLLAFGVVDDPVVVNAPRVVDLAEADAPVFLQQEAIIALAILRIL